jgi:hypothetical protein
MSSSSSLGYNVRITNNGDADLPLNGLSVRYYLTNEVDGSFVVELDYGQVSAPPQSVGGHAASTCSAYGPKPTANTVCQTALSGLEPISPGGNLMLQLRVHTPQYQILNQTNDYSFDPTKTAFTPWDHVTVQREGMLLAGVAP